MLLYDGGYCNAVVKKWSVTANYFPNQAHGCTDVKLKNKYNHRQG